MIDYELLRRNKIPEPLIREISALAESRLKAVDDLANLKLDTQLKSIWVEAGGDPDSYERIADDLRSRTKLDESGKLQIIDGQGNLALDQNPQNLIKEMASTDSSLGRHIINPPDGGGDSLGSAPRWEKSNWEALADSRKEAKIASSG